jgi:serine/threonine protein kinase
MRCLDDQQLAVLLTWGRSEGGEVERHLDECAECRLLFDLVTRDFVGWPGRPITPGDKMGKFDIEEWLGRGAMGDLFSAHDRELGRRVALKVLKPSVRSARALTEARAMARLSHPNVVTVFEAGEADGHAYLAMELLEGGNLAGWLQGRPSANDKLRVFAALADGLAHAHAQQVVHRDFKPENVVFGKDGVPRITDFGLAISGQGVTAQVAGTRGYLAPEVLMGEPATAAADVYAFGVSLQAAFVERRSRRLNALLDRLMANMPANRPDMSRVQSELEQLLRAWQAAFARRAAMVTAAVAVLCIAGFGFKASQCRTIDGPLRLTLERLSASLSGVEHQTLRRFLDDWHPALEKECRASVFRERSASMRCIEAILHDVEERDATQRWWVLTTLPSVPRCEASSWRFDVEAILGAVRDSSECSDETRLERAAVLAQRSRLDAESALWMSLARCRAKHGKLKEAVFFRQVAMAAAERIPVDSPGALESRLREVSTLHRVNQLDAARQRSRELNRQADDLSLPPLISASIRFTRAEIAMLDGQPASAAAVYQSELPALIASVGSDHLAVRKAQHNLGAALLEQGEYESAWRVMTPLLEWGRPTSLTSDLAIAALGLGKKEDALHLGRESIRELSEKDPRILGHQGQQFLAWAKVEAEYGNPGEVLRRIRAVREIAPVTESYLDNFVAIEVQEAQALSRSGRVREALSVLDSIEHRAVQPTQRLVRWREELQTERSRCLALLGRH